MSRKTPHVASPDQVRISRTGGDAIIEYADSAVPTIRLSIGPQLRQMSDDDVLELHNDAVRRMEHCESENEHVAIEIPLGRQQLRRSDPSSPLVPRGDIVRSVIDRDEAGGLAVRVDDHALSLEDLGRMLETYAGWGMRMVFVPRDEVHVDPLIDIMDPDRLEQQSFRAREQRAARPRRDRQAVPRQAVFQLRVTLVGSDPPIWRRLLVSSNRSLGTLHRVLQAVMGWSDSHMHRFELADEGRTFSDPRFQLENCDDEGRVKLRTLLDREGAAMRYLYDFGDSWQHEVELESILEPDGAALPRCTGGARACPPEDCGGLPGYFDFLTAIRDPSHPLHREAVHWWGRDFDAEVFDLLDANRALRRFR